MSYQAESVTAKSAIDLSMERFSEYAGIPAGQLPEDEASSLQVRLYRWQAHNFPTTESDDLRMVLGIVEEFGEFAEARSWEDEDDAVADAMIFSIQLCTQMRLDWGVLLRYAFDQRKYISPRVDTISLGRLAHAVLKGAQGIRGLNDKAKYRERVAHALIELYTDLAHGQKSYDDMFTLVERTAFRVMLRVPSSLPESNRGNDATA